MSEQELQMLRDLFGKAGAIGHYGFDAMVRSTYVASWIWLIACSLAFVLVVVGFFIGCSGSLVDDSPSEYDLDLNVTVVAVSGVIGLTLMYFIALNVNGVLDPVGATIRRLLWAANC